MAITNSVRALVIQKFNSANLLAGYQPINALGIGHSVFCLRLINDATTAVTISYNGVDDHEYLRPNSDIIINFQTNAQPNTSIASMPTKTVIYVKGTAGVGTIAVTGYFQPTQ